MFLTTVAFQYARALVTALLSAFAARPAAALLTTPKVLLFSAGPTPDADSTVDQFTPCIFTGYADATPTFTAPARIGEGTMGVVAPVEFISTSADPYVSDTAIGYILYDGADAYYGGEQFAEAVPFGTAGVLLQLTVVLPLALSQSVG